MLVQISDRDDDSCPGPYFERPCVTINNAPIVVDEAPIGFVLRPHQQRNRVVASDWSQISFFFCSSAHDAPFDEDVRRSPNHRRRASTRRSRRPLRRRHRRRRRVGGRCCRPAGAYDERGGERRRPRRESIDREEGPPAHAHASRRSRRGRWSRRRTDDNRADVDADKPQKH